MVLDDDIQNEKQGQDGCQGVEPHLIFGAGANKYQAAHLHPYVGQQDPSYAEVGQLLPTAEGPQPAIAIKNTLMQAATKSDEKMLTW